MAQRRSQESVDEILKDVARQFQQEQDNSMKSNSDVDAILADLGMGRTVRPARPSVEIRPEPKKPVQPEKRLQAVEQAQPRQERPSPQRPVEQPVEVKKPKPAEKPAPVELPDREENLENPADLLQNDERFKHFFGQSVVVIPGQDSHAFEDTDEWEPPQEIKSKKKKFGFFARRKMQLEETEEQRGGDHQETVEIPSYKFGDQEEQLDRQEPAAGQQFYEARRSSPVISRAERQQAWTQSIDLLNQKDKSYTSAWAKAETKRERSFQFDVPPKPQGSGRITFASVPTKTEEKPPVRIEPVKAVQPAPAPAEAPEPESAVSGFTDELVKEGLFNFAKKSEPQPPVQQPIQTPIQPPVSAEQETEEEQVIAPPMVEEELDTGEVSLMENPAVTANTDSLEFAARIAEKINTQPIAPPPEISGLLDADAIQEESGEKPEKKGVRLFGKPKDETEEPKEEQEEIPDQEMEDDYNRPEDAVAVEADLADMVFHLRIRAIVTGVLAAALIYLGLAGGILPAISAVDPIQQPSAYLLVNLIALAAAAILSHSAITGGLSGLLGQPNQDSAPALAVIGSAAQLAAFLIMPKWYDAHTMPVLAPVAVLLLCFNAIGKQIISRVVLENFQLVSSGLDHAAAYRLRDVQLVRELAEGLEIEKPDLLLNRPTVLVRGFLANSFSQRKSDKTGKTAALVVLAAAVICAVLSFLLHKNPGETVTVLAAALALGAPLSGTLVSAVPESRLAANAGRVGAVVPGWNSIRQLGSANVVQVSMGDLFPAGCVKLHGIKTFEKERIDLAILYAASILVEASDTLQGVFLKMLQNDRRLLLPVEKLSTEIGLGFVGWIQKNRVIVGGREIMEKYGVQLPPVEFEERYTQGDRYPVYLAVSGKLFGMFIVSYKANIEAADALTNLNSDGVSFLVAGTDFILNAKIIEDIYGLLPGTVKVLSAEESDKLAPSIAWLSESEGCMIHMGSFASYAGGMLAASGAAKAERIAGNAMLILAAVACALSLVFTCLGTLAGLSLLQILLIKLAGCGVVVVLALVQRYK